MGIWRLLRAGQFGAVIREGRLALRLLGDPRVPGWAKLMAGGALLYVISPIDLVADVIPVLGQMDDIAVVLFAVDILIRATPPEVVEEHRVALARRAKV